MSNFNELFERYLNGTATNEETNELLTLVQTGKYDDQIDAHSLRMQKMKQSPPSESEKALGEKVLERIYARNTDQRKTRSLRLPRVWLAVAASIVVVMLAGWLAYQDGSIGLGNSILTYKGKDFIHLPDGSTVTLNEGSTLIYSFTETTREVTLSGEGYFDVAHDAQKPFIVHSGNVNTKVLGTAFNIKAYPGQEILVTVTRGKVEVGDEQQTYGIITPDEQIAVNTVSEKFVRKNLKAESEVAWKNHFFILDNVDMDTAAKMISERYGVAISFSNPSIKNCRLNSKFLNDEDLSVVLDVVTGTVNASYSYAVEDKKTVVIEGKGYD